MTAIIKPLLRTVKSAKQRLSRITRPASLVAVSAAVFDMARSRPTLIADNALLRHQLVVLSRTSGRPRLSSCDHILMVLLARLVPE